MKALTGQLTVVPNLPTESSGHQQLLDELNRVISPKDKLDSKNVYLGILHAASSQVNLQGGCFENAELEQLAQMLVDTPVMVGHKKQELPLGRVFKADLVMRNGEPWLRAFFYWSRSHPRAEDLRSGIDCGVYRECSLAFLYNRPECAVCRHDMRRCRHRVNETVQLGSGTVRAFYYYKEIQKVLEISLVYRGAVEGTAVSTLAADCEATGSRQMVDPFWRQNGNVIYSLDQLVEPAEHLWVEPIYHGVWLHVKITSDGITALMPNGEPFQHEALKNLQKCFVHDQLELLCQVIPVKGNSRLPLSTLSKRGKGQVVRVYVAELLSINGADLHTCGFGERRLLLESEFQVCPQVRLLPSLKCHLGQAEAAIATRASAEGLRLISEDATARLNVELRLKNQIKVRVESSADKTGLSQCKLTDTNRDSHTIPLRIPQEFSRPGSIVYAKPHGNDLESFEFMDTSPGDAHPDSTETLDRLREATRRSEFTMLRTELGDVYLYLRVKGQRFWLKIKQLNLQLLMQGRHFWAEQLNEQEMSSQLVGSASIQDRGMIVAFDKSTAQTQRLKLCGRRFTGDFLMARANMGEGSRYLFSLARTTQPVLENYDE